MSIAPYRLSMPLVRVVLADLGIRPADVLRVAGLPADLFIRDEALLPPRQYYALFEALETLDLERRAVIVMHDWDGEPMPEVARALGIPLNTAYSRLRLARQDLGVAVKRVSRTRGAR